MNKNLIIGLLVLAVLLIVGAALYSMRPKDNTAQTPVPQMQQKDDTASQEAQPQQSGIDTTGKTLKDFMEGKLGENVKCDFSQISADDNRIDGTTYVADKKVRLDYKTQLADQGLKEMHMISDGSYGYIWGDDMINNAIQGTKFKINTDAANQDTNEQGDKSLDYKSPITNCEVWNIDSSKFEIPKGVNFVNLEELQGQVLPNPAAGTKDCSVCNSMAGDQKSACLKAFGCSQ
jgi:hypothetical protein